MIDTHCHLNEYPDPLAVCAEAERAHVAIIAMTNLPSQYAENHANIRQWHRVRLALGLHPLLAERHKSELDTFATYLPTTSYVGEVGLDFSRHGRSTKELQLSSFTWVLRQLHSHPKFISVHSRGAERQTFELLREFGVKPAVFHWYSGPLKLAETIALAGHYFSVNPAMVSSRAGMDIVRSLPRHCVLTETDGPFTRVGGRISVPQDVHYVARQLADVWMLELAETQAQVGANAREALSNIRSTPNTADINSTA